MTEIWPALSYRDMQDTIATLHRWLQIVGKVRLSQTPWVNHSWSVPLYVTTRGFTTSPVPYGGRIFSMDFDFITHQLRIEASDGGSHSFELAPMTVADFYAAAMAGLEDLGLPVHIHDRPNEVMDAIPFPDDRTHASYDADTAQRVWRAFLQADRLLKQFRAGFIGKCSPVHLFWGSFDIAVTRFSGRLAPTHPGGVPNLPDRIVREAYSHEVSSAGFWPGGEAIDAAFYSYAYPEPPGFNEHPTYDPDLRECLLPYEAVRQSVDPDRTVLEFLQSTYEAAARLGNWDRLALER